MFSKWRLVGTVFGAIELLKLGLISAAAQAPALSLRPSDLPILKAETARCPLSASDRIPIRCWLGQQFVVLAKKEVSQDTGYPEIERMVPYYGHPTYEELVGKIITITKVEWQQYSLSPNRSKWIVTFKAGENGPFYTVDAVPPSGAGRDDAIVDCFVLLQDLQAARQAYLNHSYWPLVPRVLKLDDDKAATPPEWITLNKFEPVQVVDVLPSSMAETPIRIVVRNETGERGYFDIAMSDTNKIGVPRRRAASFSIIMSDGDPKAGHDWSDDVWRAIESGRVIQGMTIEQVLLSLGEPLDISRSTVGGQTHEQWVYGPGKYLYFDNGILKMISN